jgi:hypothetical protein
LTITSSLERGVINGNGKVWWNGVLANTLPPGDCRPRLLKLTLCSDVLVEKLQLINSAQNTFVINAVRGEVCIDGVETSTTFSSEEIALFSFEGEER